MEGGERTKRKSSRMVYLDLQLGEGPLPQVLSLDGTHVNAKVLPYIEKAMKSCHLSHVEA